MTLESWRLQVFAANVEGDGPHRQAPVSDLSEARYPQAIGELLGTQPLLDAAVQVFEGLG